MSQQSSERSVYQAYQLDSSEVMRELGVVTGTAGRTVLGSIAVDMRRISRVETPLERKFHDFALRIGYGAMAASAALFALGILTGESVRDMFMTTVAAAVATIPEGLLIAAIIVALAAAKYIFRRVT